MAKWWETESGMTLHSILPPLSIFLTAMTLLVVAFTRRRSHSTLGLFLLPGVALLPVLADMAGLRATGTEILREAYSINMAGDFLAAATLIFFSFTYAREQTGDDLRKWRPLLALLFFGMGIALIILLMNPHMVRIVPIGQGLTILFIGETTATFLSFFLILILIFGLYQLFRTYLAASGMERWNIKYPLIGAGLWSLSVLLLHSAQITENGFDRSFFLLEIVGLILLDIFFLYTFLIQKAKEVKLSLSRTVINRSLLLLSGGLGMILLGGLASSLASLGPVWSKISGSLMGIIGVGTLLVVFSSERLRKEVTDFMGVHLYSNRYDYRAAWMSLTRALSESKSLSDLVPTLLEQTMEITFAHSIIYCQLTSTLPVVVVPQKSIGWTKSGTTGEGRILPASLLAILSEGLPIHRSEIERFLSLEEAEKAITLFDHLNATWILPLLIQDQMVGILALWTRSPGNRSLLEDRLFLQALSIQWASILYNASLSRELAWSREADLLSGLKAFAFHDLKNSGIALKLLLHNATRHIDSPEFQKELLSGLENVSEQISATVEQFLSPFHQEFTRQTSFDPNGIIRSTIQGLGLSTLPHLVLELDLSPVPQVSGNPKTFESTIKNLLINAREAMDERGEIRIESRIDQTKGVRILIADNGPGMSREFIETRLFRPFQTTKKKGSGLGLFSVKLLLEQIGGTITVDSEEGAGTRFFITIPSSSSSVNIPDMIS
jgi:signal transduction histidine kinase